MIDTYKVYYNERLPGCRVRVLGREGGAPYDGHTRDPQRLRAIHHHVAQRAAAGLAHEPRPAARVVLATHRLVSCSYYFRYYLYLFQIIHYSRWARRRSSRCRCWSRGRGSRCRPGRSRCPGPGTACAQTRSRHAHVCAAGHCLDQGM